MNDLVRALSNTYVKKAVLKKSSSFLYKEYNSPPERCNIRTKKGRSYLRF